MKKQAIRQSLRKGILFLSFLLFPIVMNFLSPYVSVNGSFAGIVSGSILLFLAQFISSLCSRTKGHVPLNLLDGPVYDNREKDRHPAAFSCFKAKA